MSDMTHNPKFHLGEQVEDKDGSRQGEVSFVGQYDPTIGGYRYKVLEASGRRTYWNEGSMKRLAKRKTLIGRDRKSPRKYYVVDQVQSGLWHQVGHFSSKTSAEAFRKQVPGRSRVVYTFPSNHDERPIVGRDRSRSKYSPSQKRQQSKNWAANEAIERGHSLESRGSYSSAAVWYEKAARLLESAGYKAKAKHWREKAKKVHPKHSGSRDKEKPSERPWRVRDSVTGTHYYFDTRSEALAFVDDVSTSEITGEPLARWRNRLTVEKNVNSVWVHIHSRHR